MYLLKNSLVKRESGLWQDDDDVLLYHLAVGPFCRSSALEDADYDDADHDHDGEKKTPRIPTMTVFDASIERNTC